MTGALWPSAPPGARWFLRLPNWVGDAIMVLPALRALARDGDRRVAAAHPRVLPLYRASGLVHVVHPAAGAWAPLRLGPAVRRGAPARAVVFTEPVTGALLAAMSGAPLRLGRGTARRPWLTHVLPPARRDRPAWRSHLELAVAAGGAAVVSPDFSLDPGDEARDRARALAGDEKGMVVVAPGAAYGDAKRWPLERYVTLVRGLGAAGARVIAMGGRDEATLGSALAAAGALDLTGKTGLLEAIAVLERAAVLVTNDSGALHLARAAGTPTVAIFGSTSPAWTGPSPEEGTVIRHDVPCSPCFRRRCPLRGEDHLRCLRGIDPDAVLAAVRNAPGRAR